MKRAKLQNELQRIRDEIKEEDKRIAVIITNEKQRLCAKYGFEFLRENSLRKDRVQYYLFLRYPEIFCIDIELLNYPLIAISFKKNYEPIINADKDFKGIKLSELQDIVASIDIAMKFLNFFKNFLNLDVDRVILRNSIITVYPLLKSELGKDVAQLICKLAWETKNGTTTDC